MPGPCLRGSQSPPSPHCCTPVPMSFWQSHALRHEEAGGKKGNNSEPVFQVKRLSLRDIKKGPYENLSVGGTKIPIFWLQFQGSFQKNTVPFWNIVSAAFWLATHTETFHRGHPASSRHDRKIKRKTDQAFRNYATGASLMRNVGDLIYSEIPNNIQ